MDDSSCCSSCWTNFEALQDNGIIIMSLLQENGIIIILLQDNGIIIMLLQDNGIIIMCVKAE